MNVDKKHIVVVGAGPGGLASAMILAHRGFRVTVFEKAKEVGGRSAAVRLGEYVFDPGPTILMMTFFLKDVFREAGRRIEDYLRFKRIDPIYRIRFGDVTLDPTSDPERMRAAVESTFPGDGNGYDRFMEEEKKRLEMLFVSLQKDYNTLSSFADTAVLRGLPYVAFGRSMFSNLGRYFNDDRLRLSLSFQAEYMGMSPWTCPTVFTMIPYGELAYGVYHVMGGINRITDAMAKVVREEGGEVHTSTPVSKLLIDGRSVKGVELDDGTKVDADDVVLNADFAYAMTHLVEPGILRKYSPENLKKKRFSSSAFVMCLGVDKIYDEPHHNWLFAGDWRSSIEDVFDRGILPTDVSVYIENPSVTDPSLAPEGKSAIYLLVFVPNNSSGIDWAREKDAFREKVLDKVAGMTSMKDLKQHIERERVITPSQWEREYNVYLGATFNLAHTMSQLLYLRPRNKFEELDHCYLVGGGTHPGSGLPSIFASARISSNLICKYYDVPFPEPTPLSSKQNVEAE
jgi:phytoene desaturase